MGSQRNLTQRSAQVLNTPTAVKVPYDHLRYAGLSVFFNEIEVA